MSKKGEKENNGGDRSGSGDQPALQKGLSSGSLNSKKKNSTIKFRKDKDKINDDKSSSSVPSKEEEVKKEKKGGIFSKMFRLGSSTSPKPVEPPKPKKIEIFIINSLDDFPEAQQKLLADVEKDLLLKDLELVCSILGFLGKCRFMTPAKHEEYLKKKEELKIQRREKRRLKLQEQKSESGEQGDQINRLSENGIDDLSASTGGKLEGEDQEGKQDQDQEEEEEEEEEFGSEDNPFSIKSLMKEGEKELIEQNPKKVFKVLDHSGKGGFGSVFQIKDKKGNIIAMKTMEHTSNKRKRSNYKEIGALKILKHPNIVEYYSAYVFSYEVSVVMEFLEGGTLTEAVRLYTFEEPQISYVAREMLKALEFLHEKQLIHRDLKSANVMMSVTGEIKIIDFGLLSQSVTGKQRRCGGSPYWMSPEMIRMSGYDTKNDIWSFAVCILELGKIYNSGSNFKVMFTVATQGWPDPFQDPTHSKWSHSFQDFIGHCLAVNPEERWSPTQLLQHNFISKAADKSAMKTILTSVFIHNALKFFS